jgi:hypothetical protein
MKDKPLEGIRACAEARLSLGAAGVGAADRGASGAGAHASRPRPPQEGRGNGAYPYPRSAGVGATVAGAPNRRQGQRENLGRSHTARIWATVRAPLRFGPPRTACSKQWHTVSGPAQPSRGTRAESFEPDARADRPGDGDADQEAAHHPARDGALLLSPGQAGEAE